MKFNLNLIVSIVIIFVIDAIWINTLAGSFYLEQLAEIGRIEEGAWNIRVLPGVLVYLCMAVVIEVFIFGNPAIKGMKSTVFHGALLGFCVYGVYDFTNRAVLENYPVTMVIVDVAWGSVLFTAVAYLKYQLKNKLSFL